MKTSHSNPLPPRPRVNSGYLPWIQAFRHHVPLLAEFARFPRPLSIAARNAYLTFPTASQYAPHLGRYYKAPSDTISTYRPASMLMLFQNLNEIIAYACSWCDADDARARKEEAAARLKLKQIVTPEQVSDADASISLQMVRDLAKSLSLPLTYNNVQ